MSPARLVEHPDSRGLTHGERRLAGEVFGTAINYDAVTVNQRKWWPLQPRHITMAPDGHLWFHPHSPSYCGDFRDTSLAGQALFIHEMTHVYQSQKRGRFYLPLMRHPFCRYDYEFVPGKSFDRYGIEQQAEIVRHVFLMRRGASIDDKPPLEILESILPF